MDYKQNKNVIRFLLTSIDKTLLTMVFLPQKLIGSEMQTNGLNKGKYNAVILLMLLFSGLFPEGWAQSGFSAWCGDSGGISYTSGQLFYHQYCSGLAVSEGVEQAYLLRDTIIDDGCEGIAYSDFGVEYGDTLEEGLYRSRKYEHFTRNGYDSVSVHLLTVYPNTVTYDTLFLAEGELGSSVVGESVDSLRSSHGCDSVVFRMVYAVSCPSDYLAMAPYGIAEVSFLVAEPTVTPSSEGISVTSDAPLLLTVGSPVQLAWQLAVGTDTFRCVQNVLVDFPPCGDGFTAEDGDGNVYETVRVGADCWLKENIRATHYAGTGDSIAVADVYHADLFPDTIFNLQNYGRLYSWYSAVGLPENSTEYPPANADGEVQGVCPVGWHLPTAAELSVLQRYDGVELKALGDLWVGEVPNNASQWSVVPGGMYNITLNRYEELRTGAHLWLSDDVSPRVSNSAYLRYVCSELEIMRLNKNNGCSVRCAKD